MNATKGYVVADSFCDAIEPNIVSFREIDSGFSNNLDELRDHARLHPIPTFRWLSESR